MKKRAALSLLCLLGIALFFALRAPSSQGKSGTPPARSPQLASERPGVPSSVTPAEVDRSKSRPVAAKGPRQVFSAAWGGAADQLGRERAVEGNPLGPMSVAVDGTGRVHVLDGVNGRLVRRDAQGKPDGTVRIDVTNPEDIAVGADGSTAVLDRHADKSVAMYDASGKLLGKLPLAGEGVPDLGSVTGVFVDGSDVYVEREHASLVKIGTTNGAAAEPRLEIPGRPSRDGRSFLKAGIIEAPAGRAYVSSVERPSQEHRFTRELRLESRVRSILLLDTDKSGIIYFAAEVGSTPGDETIALWCLDGTSGVPLGSAQLPANKLPEESFRDFAVLDGGGVIHALRTEAGVTYTRYDCE